MSAEKLKKIYLILLVIAPFATLFPIFAGYLISFLLLLALTAFRRQGVTVGVWSDRNTKYGAIRAIDLGIIAYLLSIGISGIAASHFSSYEQFNRDLLREWLRIFIKYFALWWILSRAYLNTKLSTLDSRMASSALLCFLSIYAIYVVAQRYLGIDWVHGPFAKLPGHRFAYGVYRISGAMSHPLTLSYSLLVLFLGFLVLMRVPASSSVSIYDRTTSLKALFLVGFMLFISGSRWPIFLGVLAICGSTIHLFRREHWKLVLVGAVGFAALLWLEGSLKGRIFELLADKPVAPSEDPGRLVFWKIHWKIFKDNWVFGAGLDGLRTARLDYYALEGYNIKIYPAHNMYLEVASASGVVGFGGFIFMLERIFSALKANALASDKAKVAFLFFGILLAGALQNVMQDSECLLTIWVVLSLVIVSLIAAKVDHGTRTTDNHKPRSN